MTLRVLSRKYPERLVERIVTKQMRLTAADAELYDNAMRVVRIALDIAETFTGRQIAESTVEVGLSGFRSVLDIPVAPVSEIVKIEYYDETDTRLSLSETDYSLTASGNYVLIDVFKLPSLTAKPRREKVFITLKSGYSDIPEGDNAAVRTVPGSIEAAIQLTSGTLFEAEGEAIIGRSVSQLPLTAQSLLHPFRLSPYASEM